MSHTNDCWEAHNPGHAQCLSMCLVGVTSPSPHRGAHSKFPKLPYFSFWHHQDPNAYNDAPNVVPSAYDPSYCPQPTFLTYFAPGPRNSSRNACKKKKNTWRAFFLRGQVLHSPDPPKPIGSLLTLKRNEDLPIESQTARRNPNRGTRPTRPTPMTVRRLAALGMRTALACATWVLLAPPLIQGHTENSQFCSPDALGTQTRPIILQALPHLPVISLLSTAHHPHLFTMRSTMAVAMPVKRTKSSRALLFRGRQLHSPDPSNAHWLPLHTCP